MTDEQIRKILDDDYDPAREDTWQAMAREFYSRRMRSVAIMVWAWAIIFLGGAVYCAVRFAYTDQTKSQIMYAALFVCLVLSIGFIKVFAWEMINRNNIKREIKRLELRIAELANRPEGA
ncbi:MAG: hypothetical protein JSW27_02230 [Phycisphaerales bacterium]|nr:MAG: hypothetical protein JSW27_02230 [Phycisphaerales bacterium]